MNMFKRTSAGFALVTTALLGSAAFQVGVANATPATFGTTITTVHV